MITWTPIADLPDELKDGRGVLCWMEGLGAEVVFWGVEYFEGAERQNWCDKEAGIGYVTVTHFAEITPPGQQFAFIRDPERPSGPPDPIPYP